MKEPDYELAITNLEVRLMFNRMDVAIILEFKVFQPRKEKELADTVKAVLEQIEEKNYEAVYNDDNMFAGHWIVVLWNGRCRVYRGEYRRVGIKGWSLYHVNM